MKKTLNFRILLLLFGIVSGFSLSAQQIISGKLMDQSTNIAISNAFVETIGGDESSYTDDLGKFILYTDLVGDIQLQISKNGYANQVIDLKLIEGESMDVGKIEMGYESVGDVGEGFATISLADLNDDEADGNNDVVSVLSASWDPFLSNSAYNFGAVRYNHRGYDQDQSRTSLNGVIFNDLEDGSVYWGLWGGLNDVTRAKTSQHGLFATSYDIGGLSGTQNIDMRTSAQWAQTRVTYVFSNISAVHQLRVTHSTGMMSNGWAFSASAGRRYAESGYIPGTFYDAYSYFLGAEKKLNDKHSINLNVFAAPSKRGRPNSTFLEVYELAGDNFYNSNWGYLGGKVKNARQYRSHQPVAVLSHYWNVSDNTQINTTIAHQNGYNSSTSLDWFLAADPRPDYYRNLPSFVEDPLIADQVTEFFSNNPERLQLPFDLMIESNQRTNQFTSDFSAALGTAIPEGNLANYNIRRDHFDLKKYAFNTNINTVLNSNINLNGGLSFIYDINENYQILHDMLGGDFGIDINRFNVRDFPGNNDALQNDLNNPNRIIGEGDRFGYSYKSHNQQARAWGLAEFVFPKVDVFFGAGAEYGKFWREGLVKNGLFPDSSFGDSEKIDFLTGTLKSGLTYKINGRNYAYANGIYQTKAPYSRYSFVSPRTRNDIAPGLKEVTYYGGEVGYLFRYPWLNLRFTAYYTKSTDEIEVRSFYEDESRTFVNSILSGVDKTYQGIEFGANAKINSVWSLQTAVAAGQFRYASRPSLNLYQDNSAEILVEDRTVFIDNYRLPGMPELSSTFGLKYTNPNFWEVTLGGSYFANRYVDINPNRRTINATQGTSRNENPELWYSIIEQTELGDAFTLDLFFKKSWKIKGQKIALNLSIDNLLDTQDILKYGFEQLRFDFETKDVNRFANRYYYNYGRTYRLEISYTL